MGKTSLENNFCRSASSRRLDQHLRHLSESKTLICYRFRRWGVHVYNIRKMPDRFLEFTNLFMLILYQKHGKKRLRFEKKKKTGKLALLFIRPGRSVNRVIGEYIHTNLGKMKKKIRS